MLVNLRVGQNKKPLEEGEKVRVHEGSRNWILDITIIKSIKTDQEWGKRNSHNFAILQNPSTVYKPTVEYKKNSFPTEKGDADPDKIWSIKS